MVSISKNIGNRRELCTLLNMTNSIKKNKWRYQTNKKSICSDENEKKLLVSSHSLSGEIEVVQGFAMSCYITNDY